MRNIILVFFLITLLECCKTYSYFNSANDLSNEYCQVFLTDGTEVDGKLTVQFETGHEANKYLVMQLAGTEKRRILVTDIQYYKYKEGYYFPKEINLDRYEGAGREKTYTPNVNNILFMKRLTGEAAKMDFFQLYKSRNNTLDGKEEFEYYISFRTDNRFAAWNIRGNAFFPNFEEKMARLVDDCPALAEKIRRKENSYKVSPMALDARKYEIFKKIIEEYNRCK